MSNNHTSKEHDPIPSGYITLVEAFKIQFQRRFREEANLAAINAQLNRRDRIFEDLVSAFSAGQLDAFYRTPGTNEHCRILPETWRDEGTYPLRLFTEGKVHHVSEGPWIELSGRTPFVNEEEFRTWSNRSTGAELPPVKNTDPMDLDIWSIGAVIAWITWRNAEFVAKYQDEPFYELGLEHAVSVSEYLLKNPDYADYKTMVSPEKAFEELRANCLDGSISATAIDLKTISPVQIPSLEWAHLIIDNSSRPEPIDQNCLLVAGGAPMYRDVKFKSADVLEIWLPIGAQKSDKKISGLNPKTETVNTTPVWSPHNRKRLIAEARKIALELKAELKGDEKPAIDKMVAKIQERLKPDTLARDPIRAVWKEICGYETSKQGRSTK